MSENSKIEWTEATWNPLAGCSLVSPECLNCYAMLMAHRLAKMGQAKYQGLTRVIEHGSNKGKIVWTGLVRLDPESLDVPLNRKKPTLYFVNSMSDMFHESLDLSGIHWVIVGGESGPGARITRLEWIRSIVKQCKAAKVPCFVKQLGAHPFSVADHITYRGCKESKPDGFYRFLNDGKGGDMAEWPEDLRVREYPEQGQ